MPATLHQVHVHRTPMLLVNGAWKRRPKPLETKRLDAVVYGWRVRVHFVPGDWRDFYLTTGAAVSATMRDWVLDADDAKRLREAAGRG